MATKTQNIYIKELDNDPYALRVYSDLTDKQFKDLEGIGYVYRHNTVHVTVDIDPRYTPESVKADIRALASPSPLRCTLGTVGVWTPVDVALPMPGIKAVVRGDFATWLRSDYYVAERKFCPRGPHGARIEWLNRSMIIDGVTHWTPIPPE